MQRHSGPTSFAAEILFLWAVFAMAEALQGKVGSKAQGSELKFCAVRPSPP